MQPTAACSLTRTDMTATTLSSASCLLWLVGAKPEWYAFLSLSLSLMSEEWLVVGWLNDCVLDCLKQFWWTDIWARMSTCYRKLWWCTNGYECARCILKLAWNISCNSLFLPIVTFMRVRRRRGEE